MNPAAFTILILVALILAILATIKAVSPFGVALILICIALLIGRRLP